MVRAMAAPTIASVATPDPVPTLDPIACCGSVRNDVLDSGDAETLARAFAALSDPIRLRMLFDEVARADFLTPFGGDRRRTG